MFIVLNSVLNEVPFPYNRAYITPPKFLYEFSLNELNYLKWLLTTIFIISNSILSAAIIHVRFLVRQYIRYLIGFLSLCIFAGIVLSIIGWVLGDAFRFYIWQREIAGLLQSPLLLFLYYPLILFIEDKKLKDNDE